MAALTMIEIIKGWWQAKDARQKDEALNSSIDEPVIFYPLFSPKLDCAVFHVSPISGDKVDILLAVYPHFLLDRKDRYNAVFVLHFTAQRRETKYDGMSYHFAYVKVVDAYTMTEPDAKYPDLYKAFETDNDVNTFKREFTRPYSHLVNISGLLGWHQAYIDGMEKSPNPRRWEINSMDYLVLVLKDEAVEIIDEINEKAFAYLYAVPVEYKDMKCRGVEDKNRFIIGFEYDRIWKRKDHFDGFVTRNGEIKFFDYADYPAYDDLKDDMDKAEAWIEKH